MKLDLNLFRNMKQNQKILGTILGVTLVTSAISAYSAHSAVRGSIDAAKERELKTVATLIQNDLTEQSNKAIARATMVARMPVVLNAMRTSNRQMLVDALVPMFLILREKYGVRECQFHTAPATSFLRVYDVTAGHGEDLSSFREMVVMANRKKQAQQGVEIGRRGLSIRGVDVIADENGHYGSVEVGMDFSSILNNAKKNAGFDAGVFVDDKKMSDIATLIPKPDAERIIAGFRNTESTDWNMVKAVVNPEILSSVTDVSTQLISRGGVDYGLVVVPLLDFKGANIGSVIAVKSFQEFQNQIMWSLVRSISAAFFQGFILMGVMLVMINAFFVGPAGGEKPKE